MCNEGRKTLHNMYKYFVYLFKKIHLFTQNFPTIKFWFVYVAAMSITWRGWFWALFYIASSNLRRPDQIKLVSKACVIRSKIPVSRRRIISLSRKVKISVRARGHSQLSDRHRFRIFHSMHWILIFTKVKSLCLPVFSDFTRFLTNEVFPFILS